MRIHDFAMIVVAAAAAALIPTGSTAQPSQSLHSLKWFVHVDLVTGSRPLSFFQDLIAESNSDATALIQGNQGPADTPCCVGIDDLSVQTFGSAGDGLDIIDDSTELGALDAIGLPGSRAFVVERLNFCTIPGNPIGCSDQASCAASPTDQILVISMQAHDEFDSFAHTLAHERGHNACLTHTSSNACDLMAGASGGGCLSAAECSELVEEATSVSGVCGCYENATALQPDGTSCVELAGGLCSGGVCGGPASDASTRLFAAGAAGSLTGGPFDDPLTMGALTANWIDLGTFSNGRQPEGLAYAAERQLLYGVAPVGGANVLITIDLNSGVTTDVATLNGVDPGERLVALAWDPGPTASLIDDRLFALDSNPADECNDLYTIDLVSNGVTKIANGLDLCGSVNPPVEGFRGLAYDPSTTTLFATAPFGSGLYRIDLTCPFFCQAVEISSASALLSKLEPGLAFSGGAVYHVGRQNGPRIEYDSYDAADLLVGVVTKREVTRGIDGFSSGGLAAFPAPEPAIQPWVVLLVLYGMRRRAYSASKTAS